MAYSIRANGARSSALRTLHRRTAGLFADLANRRSMGPLGAGMASRHETLARRFVRDVWAYTGGQAGRWAMLHSIARRLVLRDAEAVDRAVSWPRKTDG